VVDVLVGVSKVAVGVGVVRVNLDGFLVAHDCCRELPSIFVSRPEVVVGLGECGVQLDGSLVALDCVLELVAVF
jgi:hypothetical protein